MTQDLSKGFGRSKIDRIGEAMRTLHKALLDDTQRDYEKTHGKVTSPYTLFSLVTQDPAFLWLQPMTRMIVDIEDIGTPKGPPASEAIIAEMKKRIEKLLTDDGAFSQRYLARLQAVPEVAVEHGRLHSVLKDAVR
jgi:hypothetical protein